MLIFVIGMAEMVLSTLWARYVQDKSIAGSTSVTMIHVFVWYYVLRTFIDQIDNIMIVVAYALGCGVGNVIAIVIGEYSEKDLIRKRRPKKQTKPRESGVTIPAVQQFQAYESH